MVSSFVSSYFYDDIVPQKNHLVKTQLFGKTVTPEADITYHCQVTYTIVLSNVGGADASGALLTDTLPAEVDFARWLERSGASRSGDRITWSGTVTAGEAITFSFVVSHVGDYGDEVINTASYSHASGGGDAAATFSVKVGLSTAPIYLPVILKAYAPAP